MALAPPYPVLLSYTLTTSEHSHVFSVNRCGVSTKYSLYRITISSTTKLHPQYFGTLMCVLCEQVVLVPNNVFSTTISSTTKVHPQHYMRITVKANRCMVQVHIPILVPAPQYPAAVLLNYTHGHSTSNSEHSCVFCVKAGGASA